MGYLVLQSKDDKAFDVIDGQQRLTTLTLIVLAVLKNLHKLIEANNNAEKNRQRLEQIRQTYIGYLDPVTLVARTKLTLNRNNNDYFQTYLVPLGHLRRQNLRASERNLLKAFDWFAEHISEHIKGAADEGVALASLVETMSDRLFFTVISVTDELNAYKVFETLNARGVRLSSTDLLKNYLFSVLHSSGESSHEMSVLEDRWEAMVDRLGSESFSDFLRMHWNSRKPFVRQSELFKVIRNSVFDRGAVFDLLRGMDEDIETYMALRIPEASEWPSKLKDYAQQLHMFSVRQPFPLLMAAWRKISLTDCEGLLRGCMVISFRYNVIGSQLPHDQERVYHDTAQKISDGRIASLSEALEAMRSIYPNDEVFRAAFAEKILNTKSHRNMRVVRYVLCELERQTSGQELDFGSDGLSVEHVLPQNPQSGWTGFSDEVRNALVYRLGNMTLLNKKDNRTIGNAEFAVKKPVFTASNFQLTRELAEENSEWTPERIAARQKTMATLATSIWRIPQLSWLCMSGSPAEVESREESGRAWRKPE